MAADPDPFTDPFGVLKLVPHCCEEECAHCATAMKKSYRQLQLENHPDKGGSTERCQAINNAYDQLKDPAKRAQHARTFLRQSGSRAQRVVSPTNARRSQPSECHTGHANASRGETHRESRSSGVHSKASREEKRADAQQHDRNRAKQQEFHSEFSAAWKKQQRQKQTKKQPDETNAERTDRLQLEKEAWKEECRRRRREGEEKARVRAELNAARRAQGCG